jgi:hypothetical protein
MSPCAGAAAPSAVSLLGQIFQEQGVHRSFEPDGQVRDVAFGEPHEAAELRAREGFICAVEGEGADKELSGSENGRSAEPAARS